MIICLFCSDSSDGETAIKHKTFRMADLQMLYFRNLGTAYTMWTSTKFSLDS